MASLKSLKLEDSCRRVASILQHLSIMPECTIHLVSHINDNEPLDSIPVLRDALASHLASGADGDAFSFARVAVADMSSHCLAFDAWLPIQGDLCILPHASPAVPAHLVQVFEWSHPSSFSSRLSLLAQAGFPVPCVSRVQEAKLPVHMLAWEDMLPGFFAALRSVEKLTLFNALKQDPSGADKYTFVRREDSRAKHVSTPPSHDRMFPACRKLCLRYLSKEGLALRIAGSESLVDFLSEVVVDPSSLSETDAADVEGDWPEDKRAAIRERFVGNHSFLRDAFQVAKDHVLPLIVGSWFVRLFVAHGDVRLVAWAHALLTDGVGFTESFLIMGAVGMLVYAGVDVRLASCIYAYLVTRSFFVASTIGLLVSYGVSLARVEMAYVVIRLLLAFSDLSRSLGFSYYSISSS